MLLRMLAEREGGGFGGSRPARGPILRMALANRARNEPTASAGLADEAGHKEAIGGLLPRRPREEWQIPDAGSANPDAQLLFELQNRVRHLEEEVERLRAAQLKQLLLRNQKSVTGNVDGAASRKKPGRGAPKAR
jgi:hypothetical protein